MNQKPLFSKADMLHTNVLGIDIDGRLFWNVHIFNICNKLNSGVFTMRKVNQLINHSAAVTTYYALSESVMRYSLFIWSSAAQIHRYHPKKS